MKRIFYLLSLLVTANAVTGQDTTQLFHCLKFGYSIRVPNSWGVNDYIGDSTNIYISSGKGDYMALSLTAYEISKYSVKKSFDIACTVYIKQLDDGEIPDTIIAEGKTKINGIECHWVKHEFGDEYDVGGLPKLTALDYLFDIGKGYMMSVRFTATVKDYPNFESMFLSSISSFKKDR